MEPTLQRGSHVSAERLVAPPARGDVLVLQSPTNPKDEFVKRVVAVAGDTFEVRAGGRPWLNGKEVPHCVVGHAAWTDGNGETLSGEIDVEFLGTVVYLTLMAEGGTAAFSGTPTLALTTVPAGTVMVLGDNRADSLDSRTWTQVKGGAIPLTDLKYRVAYRLPPLPAGATPELKAALAKCLAAGPPADQFPLLLLLELAGPPAVWQTLESSVTA